jgi:hypothetical protein
VGDTSEGLIHGALSNGISLNVASSPLSGYVSRVKGRSEKGGRILRNEWAEARIVGFDFSGVHFKKLDQET